MPLFKMTYVRTGIQQAVQYIFKTLAPYKRTDYPRNSLLYLLMKGNTSIKRHMHRTRKSIEEVNAEFREEHVLFPILHDTFGEDLFDRISRQMQDFDLLYADVTKVLRRAFTRV